MVRSGRAKKKTLIKICGALQRLSHWSLLLRTTQAYKIGSGENTLIEERWTMRTSLTQAEVTALRCAIPELSHIPAGAPETGLGKESENLEQSYIHGEG